ncbi:MAG: hypothetical protein R3F11_14415 [Verrucomicrobiales bacterium]
MKQHGILNPYQQQWSVSDNLYCVRGREVAISGMAEYFEKAARIRIASRQGSSLFVWARSPEYPYNPESYNGGNVDVTKRDVLLDFPRINPNNFYMLNFLKRYDQKMKMRL